MGLSRGARVASPDASDRGRCQASPLPTPLVAGRRAEPCAAWTRQSPALPTRPHRPLQLDGSDRGSQGKLRIWRRVTRTHTRNCNLPHTSADSARTTEFSSRAGRRNDKPRSKKKQEKVSGTEITLFASDIGS